RPPRPRNERLLSLPLLLRAYLFLGIIESAVAMGGFFLYLFANGWTWGTPLDWSSPLYRQATTVTFAGIVLAQVANVLACRSDRLSAFKLDWRTNPLMVWGIAIELTILALIAYTPTGNELFGTSPLPLWIFGALVLGSLTLLLVEEGRKLLVTRFRHRRSHGPIETVH
ncbi:MAG: cation-transporting P-type ATPase, partial [Nitrospira sp.]|nr:cation-transporting P-type ATPase [Nitrospira sp.]